MGIERVMNIYKSYAIVGGKPKLVYFDENENVLYDLTTEQRLLAKTFRYNPGDICKRIKEDGVVCGKPLSPKNARREIDDKGNWTKKWICVAHCANDYDRRHHCRKEATDIVRNCYNPMSKEFQDDAKMLGMTGRQLVRTYQKEGINIQRGIYKSKSRRWYTNEELLNFLVTFCEDNGRVPGQKDFMNNPEYPHYSVYHEVFGGWNNALKLAKLNIGKREKIYTIEELLNFLTIFREKNGRVPVSNDFRANPEYPHLSTYNRRFGGFSNALKLVGMDRDMMLENGDLSKNIYRGRLVEILVVRMFGDGAIDLSGENYLSYCDGISPCGHIYEVKSAGLLRGKYWTFDTGNKDKDDDKEAIEFYYFVAFNKDFTKLFYAWMVPGEIAEGNSFTVNFDCKGKFNVENMKEYDITDEFKKVFNMWKK